MRTSIALLAIVAIAATVSAQDTQPQPETALPCFQEKCSGLIDAVKVCNLTVDGSGNINFPVTNDTSSTDKCLCSQNIVNNFGKHQAKRKSKTGEPSLFYFTSKLDNGQQATAIEYLTLSLIHPLSLPPMLPSKVLCSPTLNVMARMS